MSRKCIGNYGHAFIPLKEEVLTEGFVFGGQRAFYKKCSKCGKIVKEVLVGITTFNIRR